MRYSGYGKETVEGLQDISVFSMKKWGFFNEKGMRYGKFTWGKGEGKSNIDYVWNQDDSSLQLIYRFTDIPDDPKASQDYKVRLSTTPCNYGGVRYWLHCPLCSNRVGKIYIAGKYVFACRTCWRLTYAICNASGSERVLGKTMSHPEIEKLKSSIRCRYYKGKMTKRYKKYIQSELKFISMLGIWADESRELMKRVKPNSLT